MCAPARTFTLDPPGGLGGEPDQPRTIAPGPNAGFGALAASRRTGFQLSLE